MMKLRRLLVLALACFSLAVSAACAQRQSQNVYSYREVGKTGSVLFGTLITAREVEIVGENSNAGTLIGGVAGAGAGAYMGGGSGKLWTAGAGALLGALAGSVAEQAMADRKGIEYVVTLESGVTQTIVQEMGEGEQILMPGTRVMVQVGNGDYQRVLPANAMPTEIERPKGIKVIDSK